MIRILSIWIFFGLTNATAGVVNFDEAIGGDLPFGPQLPTFSLGIGINTFSGTITGSGIDNLLSIEWDMDAFRFSIPAGTRIQSIFQTLDNINLDNIIQLESRSDFFCGLCGVPITLRLEMTESPMGPLLWYAGDVEFPGPPNFSISLGLSSSHFILPFDASWEYQIAITVAPIPVPGAIWLFASAITLFGGLSLIRGHGEITSR